jgi:hypothetical protein
MTNNDIKGEDLRARCLARRAIAQPVFDRLEHERIRLEKTWFDVHNWVLCGGAEPRIIQISRRKAPQVTNEGG